jgi:hypothetical protein
MERPPMTTRFAALFFAIFFATEAQAQDAKSVKIHVHLDLSIERLTPVHVPRATTANDIDLILSGDKEVREVYGRSYGRLADSYNSQQALGAGRWHVIGAHMLQRTSTLPHNVNVITVNVNGKSCTATWTSQLRAGFSDYTFQSLTTHQMETYAKPFMVGSSCTIE